jgi:glycosyltransferase involved in cell wall biosynthesis
MISAVIIVRDGEKHIASCISSAKQICEEIIIILDPRTTDSTESICKSLNCKIFTHSFVDFASQKNFGVTQASYDWILSLDADEQISTSLASEIKSLLPNPPYNAYSIPRQNIIFSKKINFSNWSPEDDRHVWFFNKKFSAWVGNVHELVKVKGEIGRLNAPKIHQNYETVHQFISKLNQYTSLEAQNKNFSPLLIFYPLWKFVRHYVLKLGCLDGWHGFYLAYLQALYGLVIVVKVCLR